MRDSKNKKNNEGHRVDRNGHLIRFLLTIDEYTKIFLPYKDDARLILDGNHPDRLVLARINDLGDYLIENVFVYSRKENSRDSVMNNLEIAKTNLKKANEYIQSLSNEDNKIRCAHARANLNITHPKSGFYKHQHSQESLDKQSKTFKEIGHQQGEKNSGFGTCWIYSIAERMNKRIPLEHLSDWLSKGWIKGRKMSFV